MGRRKRNDEIAFGSDSFLDIVANIVGILIILIVIAGVRVSQMPAFRQPVESETSPTLAAVSPPVGDRPLALPKSPALIEINEGRPMPPPPHVPATSTTQELPPKRPLPELSPPKPPPELVRRLQQAQADISRLMHEKQSLSTRLQSTASTAEDVRQQVMKLRTALRQDQGTTANGRRVIAALQADVEASQRNLAGLHLELAETEANQPPPLVIRHKTTPVGRQVVGDQLWFLLANNQVAVFPAMTLTDRASQDIIQYRSQMLRGNIFDRTFGPVDGFLLRVQANVVSLSQLESWRYSGRRDDVQLLVLGVFEQTQDVVFESLAEALQKDSRFLGTCRRANRDATLTFFVYPDSFDIYQRLKEFGHDNSFDVAAHPREQGDPIKWNPISGQHSIAQ